MFTQDTKVITPVSGTPSSRATNIVCGPQELLTGFTVRTAGTGPDTVNTINSFNCTNYLTGATRSVSGSAGNTNSGNTKSLQCPTGSYMSSLSSNWRGWDGGDRVTSSVGFACKNLKNVQTYSAQAGNETIYPVACPSGYFMSGLNMTSGDVLNTITGTCINMNPREQVLNGTPTTVACCMDRGDKTICNEYKPGSGFCDNYMLTYCQKNPTDQVCSCFNVPQGLPPCYATKCLNGGYLTSNMKSSCPTQYVSCDAQVIASNSGTQLSGNYQLQQNCGQSPAAGTASGGVSTGTGGATGGTGGTTSINSPPTFTPQMQILLIFIFLVAFIVIYIQIAYKGDYAAVKAAIFG
jgi:hypothetical protein